MVRIGDTSAPRRGAGGFGHRLSGFGFQASGIRRRVSGIGHRASGVGGFGLGLGFGRVAGSVAGAGYFGFRRGQLRAWLQVRAVSVSGAGRSRFQARGGNGFECRRSGALYPGRSGALYHAGVPVPFIMRAFRCPLSGVSRYPLSGASRCPFSCGRSGTPYHASVTCTGQWSEAVVVWSAARPVTAADGDSPRPRM